MSEPIHEGPAEQFSQVNDREPVVGSPADLALPAHNQTCGDCGRPGHSTCGR